MRVSLFRFDIRLSWVFSLLILMKYSLFFEDFFLIKRFTLSPLVSGLVKKSFFFFFFFKRKEYCVKDSNEKTRDSFISNLKGETIILAQI
jgi:hypothetical protein